MHIDSETALIIEIQTKVIQKFNAQGTENVLTVHKPATVLQIMSLKLDTIVILRDKLAYSSREWQLLENSVLIGIVLWCETFLAQ